MQVTKKIFFVFSIILISGLSGIIVNRYIFPHLSTTKLFSKYDFLKKSMENVTIINKTEQVYIKDDASVNKIVSQVTSSVVNIMSYASLEKTIPGKALPVNTLGGIKNGTGLIVTSDGLIITYVTAIMPENARYKIVTSDENIYDAILLEIDSYSNLAFLKINASNLSVASFANSDDAKPGEKVIAVGNDSRGYNPFFAAGILSNFNPYYNLSEKAIASSEKLEGVFTVDIPAQAHYVGGPVVDFAGQIVAITGMNSGDGGQSFFQIPSNKAKMVIDKAIRRELNTNSTFGIYYVPISETYAVVNNLASESGALIYSPSGQQGLAIIANSPAAKSGLRINDIITAVAGEKIDTKKTLPDLLYKYKKGDQVELIVLRNKEELKIKVQL